MSWRIAILLISLTLPSESLFAQKSSKKVLITGTVVDMVGNPVPYAGFFIDGKRVNAKTRQDGSFKIKVQPGIKKIKISYQEDGWAEVDYSGESNLSIILPVLVTGRDNAAGERKDDFTDIGYGQARRGDISSDVGSVNRDKLQSRHYNNIYQMIAGEVPGVNVSGNRITIRGTSSITSGTEPLFVVNGSVVYSIDHINPYDVESIDILKGPSAAIYGARGANGAILIKLKGAQK